MQFNFWQRLVAKAVLWALFGPELPAECRVDRAICQTNKMLKNFQPNEQREIARGVLNFIYPGYHMRRYRINKTVTLTMNTDGEKERGQHEKN